jgi:Gylcosyl hydrolase family 115 C-terminal domain
MDRVTAQWQALARRTDAIARTLPARAQDAYYELVRYEVDATANLYAFRNAEFTNIRYAAQGRAATNALARRAETLFARDQAMAAYYNHALAGGKWNGWQTQPHIDYGDVARYGPDAPWQQPQLNNAAIPDVIFPAVRRIDVPRPADLGVAVDGSCQWWPHATTPAVLPAFSPYQTQPAQYLDVFNRGRTPFGYRITAAAPWVHVSPHAGVVDRQVRATVRVDWRHAPAGSTTVPIAISGAGRRVVVRAPIDNPALSRRQLHGFVEADGYVAMQADHYSRAFGGSGVHWRRLAGIGRDGAGMEPFPVTAAPVSPKAGTPRLQYRFTTTSAGPVHVWAYLSPRNDVLAHGGLRYAVSLDGQAPQLVNIQKQTGAEDATMNRQWERNTSDNVNRTVTTQVIDRPGTHTLTFWMVDPTVVLQKLVVDAGGVEESYLGPPESLRVGR